MADDRAVDDPYRVLGVDRAGSDDEIRTAARTQLRRYRRRTGHAKREVRYEAERKMEAILEAEKALLDQKGCRAYDDASAAPPSPWPYVLGGRRYGSFTELAAGLAAHPAHAHEDLRSGKLLGWLTATHPDRELITGLGQYLQRVDDVDAQLFAVVAALHPAVPPTFHGHRLSVDGLLDLARRARAGDARSRATVLAVYRSQLLPRYADSTGNPRLGELDRQWRDEVSEVRRLRWYIRSAGRPEEDPPDDEAVWARRFLDSAVVSLFCVLIDAAAMRALQQAALRHADAVTELADPRLRELGDPASASPAHLLVMSAVGRHLASVAPPVRRTGAQMTAARTTAARAPATRSRVTRSRTALVVRAGVAVVVIVVALAAWLLTRPPSNPDMSPTRCWDMLLAQASSVEQGEALAATLRDAGEPLARATDEWPGSAAASGTRAFVVASYELRSNALGSLPHLQTLVPAAMQPSISPSDGDRFQPTAEEHCEP